MQLLQPALCRAAIGLLLHSQCSWQNCFNGILPFVMASRASPPCSATSAKPAAHQKKPIDGFPNSSNKQESVLPEFCQMAERSACGHLFLPRTLYIVLWLQHLLTRLSFGML